VAVGLAAGLCAAPAEAHHAFVSDYDCKSPIRITGVISKIEWVNPHTFVHVTDARPGKPDWIFEGAPPGALERMGINHDTMKEGDTVTLNGHQAKSHLCPKSLESGKAVCTAIGGAIVLADGKISNLVEDVRVKNNSAFDRPGMTTDQLLAQLGDFCGPKVPNGN